MDRIVLVTYAFDKGGTDRVAWQLAGGFVAAGQSVTLLSCTATGSQDSEVRRAIPAGVDLVTLSPTGFGSRVGGQIRTFFAWRRWLRTHKPSIVLATGNNISWFTGLGLIGLPAPRPGLYIKTTNPIIRALNPFCIGTIRRTIYDWLFRRADGVLTLSDAETALLRHQFPAAADRFRTVYNPYLTDAFAACPSRAADHPRGTIRLLAAGRLAGQKNFPRLLRAFALALPQAPAGADIRLRIAGDGPHRAVLEALALDLGIADRVDFLGYTSDMPAQMAAADLFILSSDYEGLPAVVVEALACDCPVIATDCFPNARALLDDLPGCAVTAKDDIALGDAIGRAFSTMDGTHSARTSLRHHAMHYTTAESVRSHLTAMGQPTP